MSIKSEVDSKRREISSENLSMSVGEVLNLYKEGELDIHPEFQRVFRWVPQQKSRLIESLLLGIPLPPIYVAVNEDGIWEVIDGVQRLSTIFEFMGELSGPKSETDDEVEPKPAFVLEATKHLPSLKNVTYASLDQTLKLEFKRTRLDVKILEREKGAASTGKFDLFERLNTYGASLSPQEIRNCILVSINAPMYREIKSLAEEDSFIACTLLSDTQRSERYDMDLVLRFLTLRDVDPRQIGDVHDFLRDRMEVLALDPKFKISKEVQLFKEMFAYLDSEIGGDSFRPWDARINAFRGGFSLAAFEGLGLSIGRHWSRIKAAADEFDVSDVIKKVWASDAYKKSFSGLRARERMLRVMPVADRIIVEALEKSEVKKQKLRKRAVKVVKAKNSLGKSSNLGAKKKVKKISKK
ncbi:hypothetical protein FHT03_000724 [Xanthomonas arboricola]